MGKGQIVPYTMPISAYFLSRNKSAANDSHDPKLLRLSFKQIHNILPFHLGKLFAFPSHAQQVRPVTLSKCPPTAI